MSNLTLTSEDAPGLGHNNPPTTGTDAAAGGFDYGTLDAAIAGEMREAANRVRGIQRATVLDVGRELLAAKSRVDHGQFTAWVEAECGLTIRTAERMMRVAELVGENDKLSYLPADGLLALASRTAPRPAVAGIIARIATGEQPSAAEIKRQIATAKAVKATQHATVPEGYELVSSAHLLKLASMVEAASGFIRALGASYLAQADVVVRQQQELAAVSQAEA
jgi:hypothetical protein